MPKKYISLAKVSLQNSIVYRSTFIINICGSLLLVVSLFYIWKAIYAGRSVLANFTWDEMKAYLLVTFITSSLLTWYSETRISRKVHDGSVAMDLLKPLDFQKSRFAETMGMSLFESATSILLASIIIAIFSGIMTPRNLAAWVLFIVSLFASMMIKFGIVYIAGLFCFWTTNHVGIAWTRAAITNLFSGALIPLAFFPDWLNTIAMVLPFRGIVHIPASIYLGRITGLDAVREIVIQLVWAVVIWFAGKAMWRFGVRRVTINGG